MAGYSWGAGRYDRVREAFRFSAVACVLGISVAAAILAIFAKPLLLFTENDEVKKRELSASLPNDIKPGQAVDLPQQRFNTANR